MEVVAPVELPRYTERYTPSLCHREVQTASAGKGRVMWATKEDAQVAVFFYMGHNCGSKI